MKSHEKIDELEQKYKTINKLYEEACDQNILYEQHAKLLETVINECITNKFNYITNWNSNNHFCVQLYLKDNEKRTIIAIDRTYNFKSSTNEFMQMQFLDQCKEFKEHLNKLRGELNE